MNRSGRNQWPPVSPERLAQAKALLDDDAPISEVTRTTGLARETIHKHFPGAGWSNSQAGRHSALMKQAHRDGLL